jgi:RNA polymerase sigma-70 factor (ECF subfamily)
MSALPSIDTLFEAYSGRIYGYCLRRLPSREEAEDAVQQTFMNAYRGLRKGVVPRSEAAWLFKIAENVCRERRRSAWRRNRLEVVQDPDGMAGLAVAPERTHDELAGLADALAALPPNQQRAILMREWQGLSYREIAAQLDLTEGAVETLLFRARRSLARKLDRSRGRTWGTLVARGLGEVALRRYRREGRHDRRGGRRHRGRYACRAARARLREESRVEAHGGGCGAGLGRTRARSAPTRRHTRQAREEDAHHRPKGPGPGDSPPRTGPKRTPPPGSQPTGEAPPAPPFPPP